MKKDNDGLLMLLLSIGLFCTLAVGACIWENYHPRPVPMYMVHVDIHSDRPIEDIVHDIQYEGWTQNEIDLFESLKEQDEQQGFGLGPQDDSRTG
jgi:hypothetical protein